MNTRATVPTSSYANGIGHLKVIKDVEARSETNLLNENLARSNLVNGAKLGDCAGPSHDRQIYILANLIGRRVEVQVKNGSVISGIFHGTRVDKDFIEVILKKAQVIKEGSGRWPNYSVDTFRKPRTMIISAREFVQLVSKDVVLNPDDQSSDDHKDLMIDSVISRSHLVEVERKLEPWMPEEDDPEYPDLENIFDGTWNRNWDQFQVNEALFGVKSTFDEELYTTKLERGPQMRELERKALRIAREIEGEETEDTHLAEERGIYLSDDCELDEEIRYSAVPRVVDSRLRDAESSYLNAYSSEIFGGPLNHATTPSYLDTQSKVVNIETQLSSADSSLDDNAILGIISDEEVCLPNSIDDCDYRENSSLPMDGKSRLDQSQIKDHEEEKSFLKESKERMAFQESLVSKVDDIRTSTSLMGLSPNASAYDYSNTGEVSRPDRCNDLILPSKLVSQHVNVSKRPSSSTSSTSGSLSSEKSTLNPNAKEFRLNPNAKSFTPTSRSDRPISAGAPYYASNIVHPHMNGVSVAMGVDSSFGHQPLIYDPQATWQSPQAYTHATGSSYGQQMILGPGQPFYYLPSYQPEMPYQGTNY